jgi:Fic family protein
MQVVSGPIGCKTVHYEAPGHELLKKEMSRFLAWCNAAPKIDPVLKSAMAHFWFVTIHPFEDGNGRLARGCRPDAGAV